MDTFTHALSALVIFSIPPDGYILPFAVLGAIIPDVDVVYGAISRRSPGLYLLTHGGFTHSIAGSLATSTLAFLVAYALAITGLVPWIRPGLFGPVALLCMLAGALLHVLEDFLAYPGIPLLYPLTERKFTAGIFPGPSLVLFAVSLAFITWAAMGVAGPAALGWYAAIFFGFIGLSAAVKGYMALTYPGQTIPTFNPLRWLLLDADDRTVSLREYRFLRGITPILTLDRFQGTSAQDLEQFRDLPEVRRHRYFSYLSVAEKNGGTVTLRDPLRDRGIIPYPPSSVSVSIPDEGSGPAGTPAATGRGNR